MKSLNLVDRLLIRAAHTAILSSNLKNAQY